MFLLFLKWGDNIRALSIDLNMINRIVQPTQQITQALSLSIKMMDNLSNSTNNAAKNFNNLSNSANNAASNSSNLLNSANKVASNSSNLLNKVKTLIGGNLGFKEIKQGIISTMSGAMKLEEELLSFQRILGNKAVGEAYFESLKKRSTESAFSFEDFAANARGFMGFTKNTDKLDQLANFSERLTLRDPNQNLKSSGDAIKGAMAGDYAGLEKNFGFSKADSEILKSSKSMDDFINKFDILLNKQGLTEEMLGQDNQGVKAQIDRLKSNFNLSLAQTGEGALSLLGPALLKLNNLFSDGSFQIFFDMLSNGLSVVVKVGVFLLDIIQSIASGIQDNWGIIAPILAGVIGGVIAIKGAMIAYNIVQGISKGIQIVSAIATAIHTKTIWAKARANMAATASQWGLNAAIFACPLTWIIIAIIAIIFALVAWSVHTNGLKATWLMFTNALLISWDAIKIGAYMMANTVISCWDQLLIASAMLSIGIQNALGNMKAGGLLILQDFVNGTIGIINELIGYVNKIPGVSIETINEVTFGVEAMAENELEKAARNQELDAFIADKDAARKARENKINDMVKTAANDLVKRRAEIAASKEAHKNGSKSFNPDDILNKFNAGPDNWNKAQGAGNISNALGSNGSNGLNDVNNNLKSIDDKIDVSNEHLEMMRDLAEQESMKNFVTLTPTVQVTTGDIKEEADINKIISKIESYMATELVNSAEGVYA